MAGTLVIDTLKTSTGVLATQNGMTGIAKAWVAFAGATGTIRGSFNVSSVTRSGTGQYAVNFTTVMADTNYSAVATASDYSASSQAACQIFSSTTAVAPTTSGFNMSATTQNGASYQDPVYVCVLVIGA